MISRQAKAQWQGTLREGKGIMKFGEFEGPFTYASRFENGEGTNPEELIGAAHAGCFSMFLAALISKEKLVPTRLETTAAVHLDQEDGPKIMSIDLACRAEVPGIEEDKFKKLAQAAKAKCPISRLFAGTKITLSAELVK